MLAQGPHIYALYRYEKRLPEEIVALLYAAGFLSAAASATLAGHLADRFGRRSGCNAYCVLNALSCLIMHSHCLPMLFLGRILSGVATTLLFSVFDAWMITAYRQEGLDESVLPLGNLFKNMTALSSVVAIISGLAGDALAQLLGTRTGPFTAGALSSVAASALMTFSWQENYGSRSTDDGQWAQVKRGVRIILNKGDIATLGLALCSFEGAIYLFVFFWSAALESVRLKSGSSQQVPFGLIFSGFMCAMAAGSLTFSMSGSQASRARAAVGLLLAMLIGSACFSCAVMAEEERLLYWIFCAVEACVGLYLPSMGLLKSDMVEDDVRGGVYCLLRLPLNLLVVTMHGLDREGRSSDGE